MTSLKFGK